MKKTVFTLSALALVLVLGAGAAQAAKIQFDVGDNIGSYTGFESPGYAAGDFTNTETTWNTVVGDGPGSLFYADGSAATGVQYDIGQGGGATINWGSGPPESQAGASSTAIYNTSLMRDWHYTGGNNNLGARVSGLPAGEYRVYALVREPSELGRTYDVSIGVNLDTVGGSQTAITNAAGVTTWTAGKNYAVADVTTGSSTDWLSIIVDPTNAAYGTLEGIQIVSLGPPSTQSWTFDGPTGPDVQGWTDVRTSAVANSNTDFDAFTSAWGRNPQGGVGWLAPATNGAGGWNERDGQNDAYVIRSPAFVLGLGEISFFLQGGAAGGAAPGNFDDLGGSQFLGLALRDDVTGDYVLAKGRPTSGDGYTEVFFTEAELAPYVGGIFTLDYVDDKKGGWGWGGIDTVTVPIEIPEPATMVLLGAAACGLGGYIRRRRRA